MIFIFGKKFTAQDRANFTRILGYASIAESECRYIDLAHEDLDISNKDFIIVIGPDAYKDIRSEYINQGIFTSIHMIGRTIVDRENPFLLMHIPCSVTELMTNESQKAEGWKKITEFSALYSEFKDAASHGNQAQLSLDVSTIQSPIVDEVATQDDDLPWSYESKQNETVIEKPITIINNNDAVSQNTHIASAAQIVDADNYVINIDFNQLLAKLDEVLDLSDPAIGKTLALSEKIELSTPSGNIIIYPNGSRIKPEDGTASLSLKDSLALIRTCIMFDAKSIAFHLKK